MIRFKKLVSLFQVNADIHAFNRFFDIDMLRCSDEEFIARVGSIRYADVIRFRLQLDENDRSNRFSLVA